MLRTLHCDKAMKLSGNVRLSMLVTGPQPEDNGKESGIESESDSGNETISCETVDTSSAGYKEFLANAPSDAFGQRCSSRKLPVDLDTLDIDAFIASVTVPPPPKDDSVEPQITHNAVGRSVEAEPLVLHRMSAGMVEEPLWKQLLVTAAPMSPVMSMSQDLEEEFAKLVTPPPPSSTVTELRDIAIVPPVDVKTPSPVLGESSLMAVEFRNGSQRDETDVTANVPPLDLSDTSNNVKLSSPATNDTNTAAKLSSVGTGEYKRSVSANDVERLGSRPRSKPPVPPKRFSSLDANSTSSSSTPASSPRGSVHSVDSASGSTAPQSNDSNIENLQQRLRFWRPTDVTKPCCNPALPNGLQATLAQNGAALNSSSQGLGSLTRPKKKPPPPPPRRSSMLGKLDENADNAMSVSNANGGGDFTVTNKHVAISPVASCSSPIYSNTTGASSISVQSMTQKMNGHISGVNDNGTSRSRLKPQISASIQERQEAIQSCFRPDVEYVAIKTNVPKSPTVTRSHTFTQSNNGSKLQPHGGSTGASTLQKHSSFSHTSGDGQRRFQTFFADDSVTKSGGSQLSLDTKTSPLKQTTVSTSPVVTSPALTTGYQQVGFLKYLKKLI